MKLHFLLEQIFRINPDYELIESGHLSLPEQEALAGILSGEECYGVFRPVTANSPLSYKVAYKEIALLYFYFQHASGLPLYLKNRYDDEINATLVKLVSEGILEIKNNDRFVSGVPARRLLYKKPTAPSNAGSSRISGLSEMAIDYALQFNYAGVQTLASRLYAFNTIPSAGNDLLHLDTTEDIERFLGMDALRLSDPSFEREWKQQQPAKPSYWMSFARRSFQRPNDPDRPTFKMYISPLIDELPQVFQISIKLLKETRACFFKTGKTLHGLIRPDKVVVYFDNYTDLMEAGNTLKKGLSRFEAQGVPFTGQLDEKGILSWGVDPPGNELMPDFEGGSWRIKVTNAIASAILQTKGECLPLSDAREYVLQKISLEGIDTHTWGYLFNDLNKQPTPFIKTESPCL